MAIRKKFIGLNSVDGERLLIDNNEALRAKDSGGSAQELLKLDSSDVLKLLKLPQVDSSLPAISSAKQLTTKEYVDAQIGSTGGDVSALELRVEAIEQDYAASGGLATLDQSGKIPLQQLPNAVLTYEGVWDASTNTPALSNGAGNADEHIGHVYRVSVAGSRDFGAGSISFEVGDYVILNSSKIWEKSDTTDTVASVNGFQGVVVLDTGDVAESGDSRYYTAARQASMEAYADQAEADAISSANSYTDSEVGSEASARAAEGLTFLKLDGSRPMTGDLAIAGNAIVGGVVGGDESLSLNASAIALSKDIAMNQPSSPLASQEASVSPSNVGLYMIGADEYEFETAVMRNQFSFKKSVPPSVTGTGSYEDLFLRMRGDHEGGAIRIEKASTENDSVETAYGETEREFSLANLAVSGPIANEHAATKGYVDSSVNSLSSALDARLDIIEGADTVEGSVAKAEKDAKDYADGIVASEEAARIAGDASTLASAASYTDAEISDLNTALQSQLDTLVIQQQQYEAKTLSAGDISNGYVDVSGPIQGTPWVMIDGVMGRPGSDFTVSGSRITWAGDFAVGGQSALEASDVVHIFFMRNFSPFV